MTTFSDHLKALEQDAPETILCNNCGERHPSIQFTENLDKCDYCLHEERTVKFQEALNEMPAGFVLTFNLMVSNYYQKLADKNSAGENILLLKKFAQEGMKYKHEKINS